MSRLQISDFNTIRAAVLAESPNAKFDVELNLNPGKSGSQKAYPDADALVAQMTQIDNILHPNGWWFDYYSAAHRKRPDLIAAINEYAANKGQTVGGNIGGGAEGESWIVPTGANVVAFVDGPDDSTGFGYGIDMAKLSATKAYISDTGTGTVLLGHIHCNPQDGLSSEPCVFMREWNATRRAAFVEYWISQQSVLGYTAMWPVFFPLCPGTVAYDATSDFLAPGSLSAGVPAANGTVYDYMRGLALGGEAGPAVTVVATSRSATVSAPEASTGSSATSSTQPTSSASPLETQSLTESSSTQHTLSPIDSTTGPTSETTTPSSSRMTSQQTAISTSHEPSQSSTAPNTEGATQPATPSQTEASTPSETEDSSQTEVSSASQTGASSSSQTATGSNADRNTYERSLMAFVPFYVAAIVMGQIRV
ncbi:uncharacterized protein B0I36DRAFT_323930 [Microdochium trichocladiopsis]|uniref:Uncharacterized protein n=1 Tax=Microdochium trichocladiopsis TaxID=1682393 RepID=A0A9P8Y864_9PEZI|nr:uncharacterized protein B0I36DRAFT_323930 [Microdochium trichocladiopsis]KAH7031448.1 hypothetical protein B0I36DRAFT_323930 [Microdochium trichocladiopsis]